MPGAVPTAAAEKFSCASAGQRHGTAAPRSLIFISPASPICHSSVCLLTQVVFPFVANFRSASCHLKPPTSVRLGTTQAQPLVPEGAAIGGTRAAPSLGFSSYRANV